MIPEMSFKLLWAPVIDAVWIDEVGQRKTWIVAAQKNFRRFSQIFQIFQVKNGRFKPIGIRQDGPNVIKQAVCESGRP